MSQTDAAGSASERATEDARLDALARYDILDTPPEQAFDRITRLTRSIFGVSMSTVTLIDGHRQWFKSRQGLATSETPRGPALCAITIREAAPLIIPDTRQDDRFRDNPFVTGSPYIRFYAGVPLVMPGDVIIGSLCAMDVSPGAFDERAIGILIDLAGVVTDEIVRRAPVEAVAPPALQLGYRRVLKAGRIAFNAGRSMVDCTIRGLSESGALIDVTSTAGIPEQFKLAILADDTSRVCRVIGKRDRFLEAAFE